MFLQNTREKRKMNNTENWYSIDKKEVLREFNTTENGISNHEAFLRLKKYGKNELKQTSKINPFFIFLQQFRSVFIYILIFAAIFSLFLKHYLDFYAILAIVLLNSFIGFFQQYGAEKTIAKMKNLLVPKVKVFRNNKLQELLASELVPGDVIQISEGDKIMADCRIISENQIQTNEAILTGESFPQNKSSEILDLETELANRENMLYTGTTIVSGNCKAIVISTGMNTEFGKIAGLVQKIKSESTPLERKMDEFSKKIAIVVIILAAISIGIGIFRGIDLYDMILTGVALAISVIPEGVPAIIAITLAFAIKRMQKHNSLIRKLPAAETLGRTTVICTDKTGTLTEEKMTVTQLYCNRKYFTLQDHSFTSENKKIDPLKISELKQLLRIGILCNNARIEKSGNKIVNVIGDPTEKALVISADTAGVLKKEETEREIRLIEYSFSSKRKLMSIVRENHVNPISYVKGAPDLLLKKCTHELVNGRIISLNEKRKKELLIAYEGMAASALRVLGFAFKEIRDKYTQDLAESGLVFVGYQGMMDPPRKEVKSAIKECLNAGIKIKMITGDSLLTAVAVSDMIGLDGGSTEESELNKLSEKEFSDMVRQKSIFARITPETKLRIIQTLKKQDEIVAVTGDGVNDVLALKEAHIGVAMGIRGSDVSREVSDIILLDDNFASIVNAVREGRRVYDNMKKSITSNLAANVGQMFIIMFALLLAWPLPLMPLAILWMNLITDSLPTLALSLEKPEKDIMRRKPINRKENILTHLGSFLLISGILAFIVTIGLFSLYFKTDLPKAQTIALTSAVFCEMFVVLSCRSNKNIWKIGWFSNKFLVYAVAIAIIFQLIAIYTPLASVFGFVKLSIGELLMITLASSLIFVVFEIKKYISSKNPMN